MIELRFAGAWKNKNYAIANGRNTIFALDRILILFYNFANNNLHKRMSVCVAIGCGICKVFVWVRFPLIYLYTIIYKQLTLGIAFV